MRSSSAFFKLFPPPKFMLMPRAGLDISDDGMCTVAYSGFGGSRKISAFDKQELPLGLFFGGDIKDEKEFVTRLTEFGKKNNLKDVKVSIPEEKAYLFQIEVPSLEQRAIEQNIEFKLEENVPITAADAIFYFDLLPKAVTGGKLKASVSVVPRSYIEHYMGLIYQAGLRPISFETTPKALARAVIHTASEKTRLLIYVMKRKTGIYVVSGNVIHFTFTFAWGTESPGETMGFPASAELRKEIDRIRSYWLTHGNGVDIVEALLVGKGSDKVEAVISSMGTTMTAKIANIWDNMINLEKYLPPISKVDSLEYGVAAGLAFYTPGSA